VGWLRGVIVDAVDPERLGAFWQAILGVPVHEREPGWLELEFGPRGSLMAFQPVDPIAHAPGRLRIDVEIGDLDAATARVEALGGALKEVVRFRPGEEHRVMTDPEGLAAARYGAASGTSYLIRPDQHVAARWLDALRARSEAMNRQHGLGGYARQAAQSRTVPEWLAALNARSDALNRQYGLGEYATTP